MFTDPLEHLLAERACFRLITDYAFYVDSGEAGRIAELFIEEGRWGGADGRWMNGKAEIAASFGQRQGLVRRTSRHVCTNLRVDFLSTTEAEGTCYLMNYRYDTPDGSVPVLPVPSETPKFVGEYYDRYVKTPEGWRFAQRRFELAFLRRGRR
jgi:hypothetical protein